VSALQKLPKCYPCNCRTQNFVENHPVASDFSALHSGKHNDEVQLWAFDVLALDGDDLRKLPLSMRKANLARLLARRPDGIFVNPFEQGEIGPELFRKACEFGWKVWSQSTATGLMNRASPSTG